MTLYPALGFDPAPGDVCALRNLLRTATSVASELDYLSRKLDAVGRVGSGWEGAAAAAFVERVGELPRYLTVANESAGAAARALALWVDHLERLKGEAASHERAAADAREDLEHAQRVLRSLSANAASDDPAARDAIACAERAVTLARGRLDAARRVAEKVLCEHERLAGGVADALERASNFAPPEPGFFERVGKALDDLVDAVASIPDQVSKWVHEHAALIKSIADVFADVATILGIVAIFLPPPANLIVGGIAALSSLGALAGHAIADRGGAEVSTLTYLSDTLGIVGFGFGAIGHLGRVGSAAAKAGHVAAGREGGIRIAEESFEYYTRIQRYGTGADVVGFGAGIGGTVREGDVPFESWAPGSPGEAALGAVSPVGLAFWNAAQEGSREDRRRKYEEIRDTWLR